VSLFVSRLPLERERVNGELRTLFDEKVFFAVIPIGEASHIRTHRCKWLVLFNDAAIDRLRGLAFTAFKGFCSRSLKVHLMRVNDFGLFFQVERFFMTFKNGLRSFIGKILFVIRKKLWVRIAHKSICAARFAHAFVTNGKLNI